MDLPDRILADCDRLGVDIMTIQDADYPQRLRQLADPPAVLYWRGRKLRVDEEAAIAVVGAREPSEYGRMAAEKFGLELSAGGALVVSGIAQGIDGCAIRGALKGGGPVISLLAGGVDRITPREHRFLAEDVAAVGALVSEYPPGTETRGGPLPPPQPYFERPCPWGCWRWSAAPSGGTMLTVNHALEQDRDVFAVPGPIDAQMSEGTNRLIQQGGQAGHLRPGHPGGVLGPLSPEAGLRRAPCRPRWPRPGWRSPGSRTGSRSGRRPRPPERPVRRPPPAGERVPRGEQKSRFTDDELTILAALADKPLGADEIVERTQIPARYVLSALTMLQVQGAVEERPGRRFYALVELEE